MKEITFYLDFVSPYAWLAFDQLPEALMGHSVSVTYKPVLFAGMLKHHGQLGPAEIAPKRDWTYRHVLWLAHRHEVDLQLPRTHPFNPLALLRLALACGEGQPNRYVCETLFRHVWCGGADALDPDRLRALTQQLVPVREVTEEAVKQSLRNNTDEALARGVFGVPTMVVDDKLFWGFDALPMLADYLGAGDRFDSTDWDAAANVHAGITRAR